MDFIDLQGASGTAYRFRRWPEMGAHPPIAGNYILLAAGSRTLVEIGVLDDLSEAPRLLANRQSGVELFTRFNVVRSAREAEHSRGHPEFGAEASANPGEHVA